MKAPESLMRPNSRVIRGNGGWIKGFIISNCFEPGETAGIS
jgi:hypothetical protein